MAANTRTSPAFTLVELLVSIAIVGLLIAVLLPSLGGARSTARSSLCASNVRQIALANDAYANDHGDRYCPGAADISANLNRWHGSRPSPGAPFTAAGGALTPYLAGDAAGGAGASVAVRACPEFVPTQLALAAAAPGAGGFERSAGGYGYNNAFVGTDRSAGEHGADGRTLWVVVSDRTGAARSRFADPSGTAGFADAAIADGNPTAGVAEYSFIEPRIWPDSVSDRPDPSIHFRHPRGRNADDGRANVAWLDGHVAPRSMTHSRLSAIYGVDPAAYGIGWFGTTDDNGEFDYP